MLGLFSVLCRFVALFCLKLFLLKVGVRYFDMSFNQFKSTTIFGDFKVEKRNVSDPIPSVVVNANATFNESVTFNNPSISGIDKVVVGLSNVDNTSDLNKPVSISAQNALNLKANDNVVVKLTGNQTIAGNKTLSGTTTINTFSASTIDVIMDKVYPVGSIYINYNSTTNPSTLLGIGTWSQISSGTFLRANTSGGTTGGSTDHNHKWYEYTNGLANAYTIDTNASAGASSYGSAGATVNIPATGSLTRDFFTDIQDHLPPYLNVIMWRRTG
jgi:hypothetical protein